MKMWYGCFGLFFIMIALHGCAGLRVVESIPEGPDNNVTIIRNFNFYGSGIHYWPTVNDTDIAGLRTKQYVNFALEPGTHSIGVHCFGGWWYSWKHDEIKASIEEDRKYYYLITPSFFGCAEIDAISQNEGIKRMNKSKRIKTGHISGCDKFVISNSNPEKAICLD